MERCAGDERMEESSQSTARVSTLRQKFLYVCTLTSADPVWCRELQGLLEKAQTRAKGSALKRFFRSARDKETLQAVSADLTDMLQRYEVCPTYVQL